MSQGRNEPPAEDRTAPPAAELAPDEDRQPAAAPPAIARRRRSAAALWLVGLLILVIGGVASSPYWAPAVGRLLPWGKGPAATDYDALAARIAALEERPAPPAIDVDAIRSAQAAMGGRVAALETAISTLRRDQEQASATKAAVAQLALRIDKIETQAASRSATEAADIDKIQQELAQRGAAARDFADRLAAFEQRLQAQSNADRTGAVQLLALLQMREAIEAARPFPAEYAAFKPLAARDPELAAAAEPLAEAARDGVASRAVLRQRLADLGGTIATAKAPATKPKWWAQALDRLRRLVTIRRIDGGAKTGPQAAVEAAQAALAQGDLAAAVAALEKLTGENAAAAQPWLRMARQRLAAETAMTHLQELLTERLGSAPAAPPAATAPATAPRAAPPQAPATPRNPS
jgi:hypothetical protein